MIMKYIHIEKKKKLLSIADEQHQQVPLSFCFWCALTNLNIQSRQSIIHNRYIYIQ